MSFEGKKVLVIGGSRGIGAAVARRLISEGATVSITYRAEQEKAAAVVAAQRLQTRELAVPLDCSRTADVRQVVETAFTDLGGVDVLVVAAGYFPSGPVTDVTDEELEQAIAVHAKAPFTAATVASKHMMDGGRIIFIGSTYATRVPTSGVTLYAMSKSSLIGLTKGLARDLGPRGITVNLVNPGSTDTDMNPADGDQADAERALTALKKYAQPSDIAATVAFLASIEANHITGTIIDVDGGANA